MGDGKYRGSWNPEPSPGAVPPPNLRIEKVLPDYPATRAKELLTKLLPPSCDDSADAMELRSLVGLLARYYIAETPTALSARIEELVEKYAGSCWYVARMIRTEPCDKQNEGSRWCEQCVAAEPVRSALRELVEGK